MWDEKAISIQINAMESSFTHLWIGQLRSALVSKQFTTYSIYIYIYIYIYVYRFNDRGAHLLTVDIWEQPLSVGPYIFLGEANEE